jgi:hypothetical protein
MISVPNASLSWQMSSTRFAALDLIATFCFISVKDYYFGCYVLTWTDLQRFPPIFYFILFILIFIRDMTYFILFYAITFLYELEIKSTKFIELKEV